MKIFNKKTLLLLGLVMMAPITANAATINLDAKTTTNLNPVELSLTAGTYRVSATESDFTAWNAWGQTTGCDQNGENCSKGWINNYSITTPTETFLTTDGGRYLTQDLALTNALSMTFTLLSDATVKFFINDSNYSDNIGGMSLNVSAVPLPAAAFLFAPALLGLMGLRRRSTKA